MDDSAENSDLSSISDEDSRRLQDREDGSTAAPGSIAAHNQAHQMYPQYQMPAGAGSIAAHNQAHQMYPQYQMPAGAGSIAAYNQAHQMYPQYQMPAGAGSIAAHNQAHQMYPQYQMPAGAGAAQNSAQKPFTGPYFCDICRDKQFSSTTSLKKHLQYHRDRDDKVQLLQASIAYSQTRSV